MAVSGDELRDTAGLARQSVVVGRAVTLARWIGTGRRPVTAGQVLRKADVPAAGAGPGGGGAPRPRARGAPPGAPPRPGGGGAPRARPGRGGGGGGGAAR